ncbi:BlaI/MecI/CopY family transcriptional regulator [Brevibacterium yomogidense]|uniref:BlaI/MecI/CopY family transcriptional regulator n=1 Tax=Brevibacterium yomogidense TaxID=946573 RepID=UPI0018DF51C4|nr:BlaI/MecI/CopY family transcriptional regulator [Brevibacterium yomogidense]
MAGKRVREWGALEAGIMKVLRGHSEPLGVKQIQNELGDPVPAYTTVMTVLDRLVKKDEVVRSSESPRRIRFQPARSAGEHASNEMMMALNTAGDRRTALLRFAGNLTADDVDLLHEAIIKPRRQKDT